MIRFAAREIIGNLEAEYRLLSLPLYLGNLPDLIP